MNRLNRAEPAPICCSTRTIRSTGGHGSPRPSPRPSAPASRSCSRSAMPPATGATSWRMRASRTPATAALMNELFVNIKVDREERPDVDHIYMSALHALGEQGGWPLTMFLTAGRRALLGRHLFPEGGALRPAGLRRCAAARSRASFATSRSSIAHEPDALMRAASRRSAAGERPAQPRPRDLDDACGAPRRAHRPGPWRPAAARRNSPTRRSSNLLWRARRRTGDAAPASASSSRCDQMAHGGIHDHLGGGFARYSVDERWLVPHFEKMLYDNAQLLELYALGGAGDRRRRSSARAAEGIVAWLDARDGCAGAAPSPPASTPTPRARKASSMSGRRRDRRGARRRTRPRSSRASTTSRRPATGKGTTSSTGSTRSDISTPRTRRGLPAMRDKLLARRSERIPPGRDDKVLADWNGLMIAALAAPRVLLDRPDWLELARARLSFRRRNRWPRRPPRPFLARRPPDLPGLRPRPRRDDARPRSRSPRRPARPTYLDEARPLVATS